MSVAPADLGRCTGHCCRGFFLPWFPTAAQPYLDGERTINGSLEEAAQVDAMLILVRPLFDNRGRPRGGIYTCRNLRPNGDCGIYATRPTLCRRYPYGNRCPFPGCTWAAARAGAVPDEPTVAASVQPWTECDPLAPLGPPELC